MILSTLYVLVTLIQGVAHFSNPTSLHACEEGRSVALYGETVEQKATSDRLATAENHQWYNDHPPRMPRNAAEWGLIASRSCLDGRTKGACFEVGGGPTTVSTGYADYVTSPTEEAVLVDGYYYLIQDGPPESASPATGNVGTWCTVSSNPVSSNTSYYSTGTSEQCYSSDAFCAPADEGE